MTLVKEKISYKNYVSNITCWDKFLNIMNGIKTQVLSTQLWSTMTGLPSVPRNFWVVGEDFMGTKSAFRQPYHQVGNKGFEVEKYP